MDRQTDKHADRRRCTDNDGHPQQIVRSAPDHSNKDTHTHTRTQEDTRVASMCLRAFQRLQPKATCLNPKPPNA